VNKYLKYLYPSIYFGVYLIIRGVILQIRLNNYDGESGLGGLIPYMLWAFGLGAIVVGFLLILTLKERLKLRIVLDSIIIILVIMWMSTSGLASWLTL